MEVISGNVSWLGNISLPIYGSSSLGNIYEEKEMELWHIVNDHVKFMCIAKQAISLNKHTSFYLQ